MGYLTLNRQLVFFNRFLPMIAMLFLIVFTGKAQVVTVTGEENNVAIEQVNYLINGEESIQTSPEGNQNPSPEDPPVRGRYSSILTAERKEPMFCDHKKSCRYTQSDTPSHIGSNEIRAWLPLSECPVRHIPSFPHRDARIY